MHKMQIKASSNGWLLISDIEIKRALINSKLALKIELKF